MTNTALRAEAGLKANIINDEDDSKNDGVVLRQSKEAGTQVQEGTTITITVNKVSQAKEATKTQTFCAGYIPPY